MSLATNFFGFGVLLTKLVGSTVFRRLGDLAKYHIEAQGITNRVSDVGGCGAELLPSGYGIITVVRV
jgi:hypothetical protein